MTLVTVGLASMMREILNHSWNSQRLGSAGIQHFSTFDELIRLNSGHPPDTIIIESTANELSLVKARVPVSNVLRILEQGKSFEWHRPQMPIERFDQMSAEQVLNLIFMAQP